MSADNDPTARPRPRFARCPKCQQLIDAASLACRFCGAHFSPGELEQAARLQEKLIQAKSRANDRSAMIFAIKALLATILIYALWFLARFMAAR